jgi:hypothetical protein
MTAAAPEVVLGKERSKFFKRPMVPFLNSVPPEVYVVLCVFWIHIDTQVSTQHVRDNVNLVFQWCLLFKFALLKPLNFRLFAPVPASETNPLQAPSQEPEPTSKSIEIQTDYRESEAQTDPYTPVCSTPLILPNCCIDVNLFVGDFFIN